MKSDSDTFDLQRFVQAQNPVFERVCRELRGGEKRSHWMWFIFPQIAGLGRSEMAQRFAINSRAEADAYLSHPVLRSRLLQCTELVLHIEGRTISQIFGYPDDLKFQSCMTLFAAVSENSIFLDVLQKYFSGAVDKATLDRL
jgi:uncharacterized protein (DUF1810 family)